MLETPHVAVGIALAKKTNPALAIILSLTSHFVLDKVPHWNPHTYTETQKFGYPTRRSLIITATDISLAFTLGLAFAFAELPNYRKAALIILCSLLSVFPDVVKYPFFLFKTKRHGFLKKWVEYERKYQVNAPLIPGIATQLATILAAAWWIAS